MINIKTKKDISKNNKVHIIECDTLYSYYDFSRNIKRNPLIKAEDISLVFNEGFYGIDHKTIETILWLAENCEIHSNAYNFYLFEDGSIKIGDRMAAIKKELKRVKNAYKKFKKRGYCTEIELEIKEERGKNNEDISKVIEKI